MDITLTCSLPIAEGALAAAGDDIIIPAVCEKRAREACQRDYHHLSQRGRSLQEGHPPEASHELLLGASHDGNWPAAPRKGLP